MSDAQISKLHGHLAELDREDTRQQAGAKQIREAASKMLDRVEKRLAEIHGMTDSAEYQRLLEDKGVLAQVLEQSQPT